MLSLKGAAVFATVNWQSLPAFACSRDQKIYRMKGQESIIGVI